MEESRLKHSLAVANKMLELGKNKYNIKDNKILQDLFVLGLVHDVGYEFTTDYQEHNTMGGTILKNSNYKYWKEVYFHGSIKIQYKSIFLDILNDADMQIDKYGNDVGYQKRLEDIKNRYGKDSTQYINSNEIIDKLMRKRES